MNPNSERPLEDPALSSPGEEKNSPEEASELPLAPEEDVIALHPSLAAIGKQLDQLQQTFESRLSYDKTKEEAFERLYGELDEFKRNTTFDQLRPLFIDFILLFDRIESIRQNLTKTAGLPAGVDDQISTLSEELVEILYRREVELVQSTGPLFDATVQLAIGTEPSANENENNTIARVIRKGFRYRNRILRPEEVIVRKQTTPNTPIKGT